MNLQLIFENYELMLQNIDSESMPGIGWLNLLLCLWCHFCQLTYDDLLFDL